MKGSCAIRFLPILWCLLVSALFTSKISASPPEESLARTWLDKRSHSIRELNYVGVFTYEYGAQISSLQVFHAVKDGVEKERLVHLSGEPMEIIRNGHELSCIHSGTRMMRVDQSIPAGPFAQSHGQHQAQIEHSYDLSLTGEDRVAGRSTVKLTIRPKDAYRYAHLLYIDKDSGLLLKSMIVDQKGRVLERFQFAQVSVGVEIIDADLESHAPGHVVAHHHQPDAQLSVLDQQQHNWQVNWVPQGYLMDNQDVRRSSRHQQGMLESYMYTDGLSAFSVFLEPAETSEGAQAAARRGATVAFTRHLLLKGDNYTVTVVGEVPSLTAEKVASSVLIAEGSPIN